jgi:transcriptional regulator with XRE-family HTH domain
MVVIGTKPVDNERITSVSTPDQEMPLAVLLFHAAMQRRMSLADFAANLHLSVATLRSYLFESGKRSRIRNKTVEQMAKVLHMSPDEVRERAELLPCGGQTFSEWLKQQMQGRFTRARLCAETKISDSAMKNYLNGHTTPDPDNAMKLAEVLGADPLEMARLIVATELSQRGVTLPPPPPTTVAAEVSPAPAQPVEAKVSASAPVSEAPATPPADGLNAEAIITAYSEQRLLNLWRRLHPQGRRATLTYIASLLAEELL